MCTIVTRIVLFVYAFYYNFGNGIVGQALGPCDFEDNPCGFTNDGSNSLNWDRTTVDGTSEQALVFMSVRPSSDKTGRITSPAVVFSNTDKCLEFSFKTKNTANFPGSLKVFYKNITGTTSERVVWSTNSSSGGYWRHILVDLYNTTQNYKIIFEAKLNRNSNEWIAVDKVSVLGGRCFNNFVCDFEDSFCMIQDGQDTTDWRRHRGSTASSRTGPSADHTLGTNLGFYAYLETSYYYYSSSYYTYNPYTGSARMKTPTQRSSSGIPERCLEFWYHMFGRNIGRLNVILKVNSNEVQIFNKTGDGGNVWKLAHVSIKEQNNYKIIFEAFRANGYRGDIAVDDIKISHEKCLIGFQCDFDHGRCFDQDSTDDKDWSIGKFTNSEDYTTVYDHTSATWRGKYAYLDSEYFRENEIARLSTPLLTSETTDKFCLIFWYNEMGEDSGQLFVFLASSGSDSGSLIWKRHVKNQYTNVWRKAEVTFVPNDNYKILFQANGGSGTDGYLAIDDIRINNEPCRNIDDFNCTFENETFCLERGASSNNYVWDRHSRFINYGAGPFFDHTFGDERGYYAFVDSHESNNINDTAVMITPVIHNAEVNDTKCLIFWYHMYGYHIESLEVFILRMVDDLPGKSIWSRSGNTGNIWRPAEVEISEENSFQVVFRSIRGGGVDGDIGVDDLQIRNGSCFNTGEKEVTGISCQFEERHLCGYTQSTDDDFDWTWTNSALGTKHDAPGIPTIDHTTSSGLGFYLIADFRSSILIRQVFRLISPVADVKPKQCLEFWHYIHGTDSQEFRVLLNQTGSSIKTILSIKGSRGPYWQRATADISPTAKYQIVFEALSGVTPNGAVTIDDVNITSGNCKVIPTAANPPQKTVKEPDCNFEKHDLCGYKQATDDEFDWSAQTAAEMANYFNGIWWYRWWGPGHQWYPRSDRSYPESDGGTFLYNEVPVWWWWWGRPLSYEYKARLLSPIIEKTDNKTCLMFWIYKQADVSDYLNVYMVPYSQVLNGDPVAQFYGSYGNRWILQKIDLPPSTENFQIIFEVINGKNHYSSSFIDEVDFERSPCTNDEMSCDFENGFVDCAVVTDRSADDLFHWQLSRGYTATKMTGPSVDHTRGDETGIYIYIDASQPQRAGDSASVSTHYWYNNEQDTCLTFWYYCNSSLSGSLFVHKHDRKTKELIWKMPRIFESRWTEVRILIPPTNTSYQIVFMGTIGDSILGDIALDDIKLSTSSCSIPSSDLPPPIDATSSSTSAALQSYDCKIEKGQFTCDINQLSSDQFDWSYSESDSSYVCTSQNKYVGQKAQLVTPPFIKNKQQCLTLVFRNSGVLVPDLSVFKLVSKSRPIILWKTNTTAEYWTTKMITIQPSPSTYNIMFEATIKNIGNGTVSIQSINLSPGKCQNSSVNQILAIFVTLIVLLTLVVIALAGYRWRKTLTFHLNVRHKTLTEDVSIGNVHNDKSPIVDA